MSDQELIVEQQRDPPLISLCVGSGDDDGGGSPSYFLKEGVLMCKWAPPCIDPQDEWGVVKQAEGPQRFCHCWTCRVCQLSGKPNQLIHPFPLYPIPIVGEPFERGGTVSWPTRWCTVRLVNIFFVFLMFVFLVFTSLGWGCYVWPS